MKFDNANEILEKEYESGLFIAYQTEPNEMSRDYIISDSKYITLFYDSNVLTISEIVIWTYTGASRFQTKSISVDKFDIEDL